MNILLDGYFDNNLGDDLMLDLASKSLQGHKIYMNENAVSDIEHLPFSQDCDIDVKLTVTGSGFLVRNNKAVLYRIRDVLADNRKCKKAVLSCNISRFPNRFAEKVILKQLSLLDFITVRDMYSYDYIKNKLPNLKCEYYPDIVFAMPKSMIAERKNEGALGISAYNRFGGNSMENDLEFARFADEFVKKTGCKVLLFAMDTGLENDLKTAKAIKGMMKYSDYAEIIEHKDILQNIKRCDKVIGIRFHSIVLALLADVSVIPIAYSEKTRNMLNDLNFDDTIFDLDKIDFDLLREKVFSQNNKFILDENIPEKAAMHMKRFREIFCNE
jgi:polysaccharide pyruvyl transferase WcaK-like protein